jgi:hypothetical protein
VFVATNVHRIRQGLALGIPSSIAFAAIVGETRGKSVIYCDRCEPGDSGSPLVNESGKVVGLISTAHEDEWMQTQTEQRHHSPQRELSIVTTRAIKAILHKDKCPALSYAVRESF